MLTEVIQEEKVDYGPPDYDALWKKIIGELFEEFMQFFAPRLHEEIDFKKEPDFLQQELFKEIIKSKKGRIVADQIVKVSLKNGEDKWILIHIEIQGEASIDFSKRMFRYFYRIYDKFDKEVYAIAVLTDDQKSQYPDYFHYDFFGTTVDYKYNMYRFQEHTIQELEKLPNPFAAVVIAGKYAIMYKNDMDKRYHFKRKLMIKILESYPLQQERSRTYITTLFYFIDYLLQTPKELEEELRIDLSEYIYKEGGQQMHAEKEVLSPTLAGVLKMIEKEEIKKAEKRGKEQGIEQGKSVGNKEAKVIFAKRLIKEDFHDEKIAELTGLALPEVVKIKRSLED